MSTAVAPPAPPAEKLYTTADLLAIPDDGIERWLIDGRIVEVGNAEGQPVTIRNKHHTLTQTLVTGELEAWRKTQPKPRGQFHSGEAGVILQHDPDRTVGIDLVYLDPATAARVMADDSTTIIDAVPTLAIEIQSPSNTLEELLSKLALYRDAGVRAVWVLNPYLRTAAIHRPGQPSVTLNETQELAGDPELPGFRVPVARLFSDD
ncbi:MAG: Uma2 family endonuclease [Gemmataceae bacterium]|nr:Uma2 family endonuclease [Gemmataceae bacterium]